MSGPDPRHQVYKSSSKSSLNKLWAWTSRLSVATSTAQDDQQNEHPPHLTADTFWPSTMDAELGKAARILRSFGDIGFSYEEGDPYAGNPLKKAGQVQRRIPLRLLQNAHGIIILTAMRSGLWVSGAGGSGLLIAKTPAGFWSQPSAVMLHSSELGFLVSTDVCDCIMLINSREALETVSNSQWSFETDISSAPGPPADENNNFIDENSHRSPEVYTYLKSNGFYSRSHIDGIIVERADINEQFYGRPISSKDILLNLSAPLKEECKLLSTALCALVENIGFGLPPLCDLPPAPSDHKVVKVKVNIFGVPDVDDPDPFGVLALEREGIGLRDAITRAVHRPTSEEFEFRPSPTSPIYQAFSRASMESPNVSRRSSHRVSYASYQSRRRSGSTLVDSSTQTDSLLHPAPLRFSSLSQALEEKPGSPNGSSDVRALSLSAHHSRTSTMDMSTASLFDPSQDLIHTISEEHEDVDEDDSPSRPKGMGGDGNPKSPPSDLKYSTEPFPELDISSLDIGANFEDDASLAESDLSDGSGDIDDDDEDEEVAVIVEHTAPVAISIGQVKLVEVRHPAPVIPPRNPGRRRVSASRDSSRTPDLEDRTLEISPNVPTDKDVLISSQTEDSPAPLYESNVDSSSSIQQSVFSTPISQHVTASPDPQSCPVDDTSSRSTPYIPSRRSSTSSSIRSHAVPEMTKTAPSSSSSASMISASSDTPSESTASISSTEVPFSDEKPPIPPRHRSDSKIKSKHAVTLSVTQIRGHLWQEDSGDEYVSA